MGKTKGTYIKGLKNCIRTLDTVTHIQNRQICDMEDELVRINERLDVLESSPLYRLFRRFLKHKKEGADGG